MDIVRGNQVIRLADKHACYQKDMEKYFDLYMNAVVPSQEGDFEVVDFSHRALQVYRHNKKPFLVESIPEEPDLMKLYLKHCPSGHLAFDFGAYCGLSTYELSKCFDRVVAFEPDYRNRACLKYNVLLHDLTNVIVWPEAIAGKSECLRFFNEGAIGSRIAKPEYIRGQFTAVQATTLTEVCERFGVPDLILMDIEGAEVAVLECSKELLKREKISFAIDTNHNMPTTTVGPVTKVLEDCGYQVETDTPYDMTTTWAWKRKAESACKTFENLL